MTITSNCSHCAAAFTFDDWQAGQQSNCPTCQGQITLVVRAPSAVNPNPPTQQQTQTRLAAGTPTGTRAQYLARVRKESSYATARGLLMLICGLLGFFGVCGIGGGASVLFGVMGGTLVTGIAGICLGFAIIVLAVGIYEASVVVFDIADVLIEEREK